MGSPDCGFIPTNGEEGGFTPINREEGGFTPMNREKEKKRRKIHTQWAHSRLWSHLTLHKHGHVHKHIVQLSYRVLQLHDVVVSRLNVRQSLPRLLRLHDDLPTAKGNTHKMVDLNAFHCNRANSQNTQFIVTRQTVRTHREVDLNAFHCNRANSQNTQKG